MQVLIEDDFEMIAGANIVVHGQQVTAVYLGSNVEMNLEEYRIDRELSYTELAEMFGLPEARTAQRYATGQTYNPVRVEQISQRTGGIVTVEAMHLAHIDYLRRAGKLDGLEYVDHRNLAKN